jgi:hypothetical protein
LGLGALCVEMNAMREKKERMPTAIEMFVQAMSMAGVSDTAGIADMLTSGGVGDGGEGPAILEDACLSAGLRCEISRVDAECS